MAKKQGISYSPNMGLIAGERDVARSEAMMDTAGGTAFAQGFTGAIMTGIEEEEKRKSIRDAYMADLGSIDNINLLDEDYNKQQVTDFVRSKRDEYAKLAAAYARNKSTDILDKMNTIKFSFSNLNKQLQGLVGERAEYLSASDKGQLVTLGNGDEMYTDMYTNRSKFSIEGNGDIGFTSGNVYSKFKDVAGKWNVNNNIYKGNFLKLDSAIVKSAAKGGDFDEIGVTNQISSLLSSQGIEEAQVAFKTDIVGDENMIIGKDKSGNNILASNLSFESIWSKGGMDKKFYEGYKPNSDGTYDTKWMFEDQNSAEGIRLKSMYDVSVLKNRHESMYKAPKGSGADGNGKRMYIGRSRIDNSSIYATQPEIKDKYDRITNARDGEVVEGWDGKREYRYIYSAPSSGNPFWLEQVWDAERSQFVTKGGSEKAAGGGGGVKRLNTSDVISEFIPQSMLQNSNTTGSGGADNLK